MVFVDVTAGLFLVLSCWTPIYASAQDTLRVLTLNFACRDILFVSECDNCQTRFDLIAKAFSGEGGFEGLPDLDNVDVIISQELGTELENFDQITRALESRGFLYSTNEPSPTASDPICDDPPTCFMQGAKGLIGGLGGYESGGLVTWSKYPIIEKYSQNWCAHAFPLPAGYLITLLDVGFGRVATVVNIHAYPEYDLPGIAGSAEDIRTYQFGELAGVTKKLQQAFSSFEVPFIIVVGGDTNEDAYSLQSNQTDVQCDLIKSDLVIDKFSSINFDVKAACDNGVIGTPTWDPTNNDLTARFSSSGTHEVLDFLIQHSHSTNVTANLGTPENVVSVFKKVEQWTGQFCSQTAGTLLPCNDFISGTANALTDHNMVTANFILPQQSGEPNATAEKGAIVFKQALSSWNTAGIADDAACGQGDSICLTNADCCGTSYSWTDEELICSRFRCQPCRRFLGFCW